MLVSIVDERVPWYLWEVETRYQFSRLTRYYQSILACVFIKLLIAENAHYFDQLIKVISTLEEGVAAENHARHRAASRPNVKAVVVVAVVNEQLGPFVIATCDAHIIFLVRVVEFSEAPVDET